MLRILCMSSVFQQLCVPLIFCCLLVASDSIPSATDTADDTTSLVVFHCWFVTSSSVTSVADTLDGTTSLVTALDEDEVRRMTQLGDVLEVGEETMGAMRMKHGIQWLDLLITEDEFGACACFSRATKLPASLVLLSRFQYLSWQVSACCFE